MSCVSEVEIVDQPESSHSWGPKFIVPDDNNPRRWVCCVCDTYIRSFAHSGTLWCHLTKKHFSQTGELFKCGECDKRFTLKADFRQHSIQRLINHHFDECTRSHYNRKYPYWSETPNPKRPYVVKTVTPLVERTEVVVDTNKNVYKRPISYQFKKLTLTNEHTYASAKEPVANFNCPQLFRSQVDFNQHQFDLNNQPNTEVIVDSLSEEISIDPVSMGLSVLIATAYEIVQDCADKIEEILKSTGEATQLESSMETQIYSGTGADPIVIDDELLIRPEPSSNPIQSAIDHVIQHSNAAENSANRVEIVASKLPNFGYYECRRCGKVFRSLAYLQSHSRYHRNSPVVSIDQSEIIDSSPKPLRRGRSADLNGQLTTNLPSSVNNQQILDVAGEIVTASSIPTEFAVTQVIQQSTAAENSANPVVLVAAKPQNSSGFACLLCGRTYVSLKGLECHLNTHEKSKIVGDQPKICIQPRSVEKHKKLPTSTDKRDKICISGQPKSLIDHERLAPSNEPNLRYQRMLKPHRCRVCGDSFQYKSDLQIHSYSHLKEIQREFPCEKCGQQLSSSSHLQAHLKRLHPTPEQLRYNCDSCKKRFAIKADLRQHSTVHRNVFHLQHVNS